MKNQYSNRYASRASSANWPVSKQTAVGVVLIVSLIAFEIFNFDTTQYALSNLIGDVRFFGIGWASILAIAFCSIDFAGLIRLFTPEQGEDEPKVVWYLMGAWLMGATMNAVMTWWAISLTLLNHNFGNEVLSRDQLLLYVPIFVAILVWLTRILFIGAFTVAGEHIFESSQPANRNKRTYSSNNSKANNARPKTSYARSSVQRVASPRRTTSDTMMRAAPKPEPAAPQLEYVDDQETQIYEQPAPQPRRQPTMGQRQPTSRVRQRPPRPNGYGNGRPVTMKAKGKNSH